MLTQLPQQQQPKRVGARTAEPASKVYFPYKVIDYEFLSQKFSGGDSYTFAALCLQRLKQQTLFNDEKWGDTPQERKFCACCVVKKSRRTKKVRGVHSLKNLGSQLYAALCDDALVRRINRM